MHRQLEAWNGMGSRRGLRKSSTWGFKMGICACSKAMTVILGVEYIQSLRLQGVSAGHRRFKVCNCLVLSPILEAFKRRIRCDEPPIGMYLS